MTMVTKAVFRVLKENGLKVFGKIFSLIRENSYIKTTSFAISREAKKLRYFYVYRFLSTGGDSN